MGTSRELYEMVINSDLPMYERDAALDGLGHMGSSEASKLLRQIEENGHLHGHLREKALDYLIRERDRLVGETDSET